MFFGGGEQTLPPQILTVNPLFGLKAIYLIRFAYDRYKIRRDGAGQIFEKSAAGKGKKAKREPAKINAGAANVYFQTTVRKKVEKFLKKRLTIFRKRFIV